MSLWLKRQQPVELYQSSDVPHVILEDGVHLCFDNCYGTQPDKSDFNISFLTQASSLKRINTYFYKFESFPIVVSFNNIVYLNDAIIEGRIIKHAAHTCGDAKNIAIIQSEYIRQVSDKELEIFSESLDGFDKTFILVGETVDPQVRLFEGISTIIPHSNWNRTLVSIAHNLCEQQDREYCWTKSLPELSISCYGIKDSEELIHINEILNSIGTQDVVLTWATK